MSPRALVRASLTLLAALAALQPSSGAPRAPVRQERAADDDTWRRLARGGAEADLAFEALAASGAAGVEAAFARLARTADARTGDATGATGAEATGADARAARRWAARLVARAGAAADVERARAALVDPDPVVRAELAAFLGRNDLGRATLDARVAALEELVARDPEPATRAAALDALTGLDEDEAVLALERLLVRADLAERRAVAARLAERPRAREVVVRRMREGLFEGTLPVDVLVELAPSYGRALAELATGGESAALRAPLVVGMQHPDPRLRVACAQGLDAFLTRALALGRSERVLQALAGLAAQGFDEHLALERRALIQLGDIGDADAALASARELEASLGFGSELATRALRARACQLEGLCAFAAGLFAEAAGPWSRAAELWDGLLAERRDEHAEELRPAHLEWMHARALVELSRALALLAQDPRPGAALLPQVTAHVRNAHVLELEAQVFAARHEELREASSLDQILDDELSPLRLLLDAPTLADWPSGPALDFVALAGRALAGVAPYELPGFEPLALDSPGSQTPPGDVLADPRRGPLLRALPVERRLSLEKQRLELFARATTAEGEELLEIQRRFDEISRQLIGLQDTEQDPLEVRFPSNLALRLAQALRNDARPREARERALAMRASLEARGLLQRYYWGFRTSAEIEMLVGGSYTDEDQPEEAERELERAVEHLEEFERTLTGRGFGDEAVAGIRSLRASALVSLAVNANVKLDQPERARAYFERAYALKQDDFMKVLLACYRARSGHADEARALVREITPGPGSYYNLACTHALLGDTERALELLRRELEESRLSPGALEKQRAWARTDPDLEPLHGDPRFQELVGP